MSDLNDTTPEPEPGVDIKAYREAMDEKARLARANDLQSRELAMLRAGIPTGTKVGQAFVRDYEGPLDDADRIKAEAIDWGLFRPEGSSADDKTPAAQAQVEADRAAMQGAGLPHDANATPPADWRREGREAYDARLAAGGRRPDAAAEIINRVLDHAIQGDPDALVQPWTKDELGYV